MPNNNVKRARGRPRKFSEENVLKLATQTFLREGFEATSYEHIAEEMGLSKPSLYNTFGDKTSLFLLVLDRYASMARAHILDNFSGRESLHDAVQNLLRRTAEFYSKPVGPAHGCLLIGTALPASTQYDGVRKILSSFIRSLDKLLEQTIEAEYSGEAQSIGQTSRVLALQVSSLIFTLAIRARMGLSKKQLVAHANELAETIKR